jgi:hypothetical protein
VIPYQPTAPPSPSPTYEYMTVGLGRHLFDFGSELGDFNTQSAPRDGCRDLANRIQWIRKHREHRVNDALPSHQPFVLSSDVPPTNDGLGHAGRHTPLKTKGGPARQAKGDPLRPRFPRRYRGLLDDPCYPTVDQSRSANERVG